MPPPLNHIERSGGIFRDMTIRVFVGAVAAG